MNIVLTGFMGTGKTRVGKKLAKRLGMRFVDSDTVIEKRAGMKISNIFARKGERAFRVLETKVIAELTKKDNMVIATGGGVVLSPLNWRNMRRNGAVVSLLARPSVIEKRVAKDSHRPLLEVCDRRKKIRQLLFKRLPLYKKADLVVDTSNVRIEGVVRKIAKWLAKKK